MLDRIERVEGRVGVLEQRADRVKHAKILEVWNELLFSQSPAQACCCFAVGSQ